MERKLITIGNVDKLDLPEFGFEDIKCKIDTGADSSSIHCSNVKLIEKDGIEKLSFRLLDKSHKEYQKKAIVIDDFSEKSIKSSNGISEIRFIIKTKTRLFGKIYPITFSLSDRSKMSYPILLGKKFLAKKFLVDVSHKDISYNKKVKK